MLKVYNFVTTTVSSHFINTDIANYRCQHLCYNPREYSPAQTPAMRTRSTALSRLPPMRRRKRRARRRGGDGWGSRGDGAVARAGVGKGARRRLERRPRKLGARQQMTPSSSSSSLLDSDRESGVGRCSAGCVAVEDARGARNSWSPWHRADVGNS